MCNWGDTIDLKVSMPPYLSSTGRWKKKVVGIDKCIYRLVKALNTAGIKTTNSCCGHGKADGQIFLHDGRVLVIKNNT